MRKLSIHASNVQGYGAVNVCQCILQEIDQRTDIVLDKVLLPYSGGLANFTFKTQRPKIIQRKRWLPKIIDRFFECWFLHYFEPIDGELLVLGDIPLSGFAQQRVLFHQANILKTHEQWSENIKYAVGRFLLRTLGAGVDQVIVQTHTVKTDFDRIMPRLAHKARCIPIPIPAWVREYQPVPVKSVADTVSQGLRLFYPAANYPYKNHALLERLTRLQDASRCIQEIRVTIEPNTQSDADGAIVKHIGYCQARQLINEYRSCHGLVFPSTSESSPLPLLEAMALDLPIIVSSLPYAHEICGDQAIYFDPLDVQSLLHACQQAQTKLMTGWRPNYQNLLNVRPADWREYTRRPPCLSSGGI